MARVVELITYPITLILTAAQAMTDVMNELAGKGTTRDLAGSMMPVKTFRDIVKMEEIHRFEQKLEEEEK